MITWAASFTDNFLESFSWMLIHSLWQGMLLAMVAVLALMAGRNLSPASRYRMVLICFALFLTGAAYTFYWYWTRTGDTVAASVIGIDSNTEWGAVDSQIISNVARYFSRNASVVVLLWFVMFVFRTVRLMRGMLDLNKLRYTGTQQAPQYWRAKINELATRLGLNRAVILLESTLVKAPAVLGHFSPVILIPAGLLTGLPAGQLEAVLLHELAHIRRHDFLVNLIQAIAETIFFFNPGLLWISELLRQEREHCCDDVAVAQTGNPKEFVQALLSFKEYALGAPELGIGFTGQKNQLTDRVVRILGMKRSSPPAGGYVFIAVSVLLLVCLLGTTLTVAQLNPSVNILKPVPEALRRLFDPEDRREGDAHESGRTGTEPQRKETETRMISTDSAAAVAPLTRLSDSSISSPELKRVIAQGRPRKAVLATQQSARYRRMAEPKRVPVEKVREKVEVRRLETIRNKSRPVRPNAHIAAPISKQ